MIDNSWWDVQTAVVVLSTSSSFRLWFHPTPLKEHVHQHTSSHTQALHSHCYRSEPWNVCTNRRHQAGNHQIWPGRSSRIHRSVLSVFIDFIMNGSMLNTIQWQMMANGQMICEKRSNVYRFPWLHQHFLVTPSADLITYRYLNDLFLFAV